ncbi:MAG: hypothetical protein PHV02_03115 [Rhodocyclaceae bacterium]|nr:hypothetical protein [Rhodocyclaceae bacterium]
MQSSIEKISPVADLGVEGDGESLISLLSTAFDATILFEAAYTLREWVHIALAVFCLLVFVGIFRSKYKEDHIKNLKRGLIRRLRAMSFVACEHELVVNVAGIRVVGRVDEVRKSERGVFVVGDTKKMRPDLEIHDDDIVSISIYRYLISKSAPGHKISIHGYIRFVDHATGKERLKIVTLHSYAWVEELIKRYSDTAHEKRSLMRYTDVAICSRCDFVSSCYQVNKPQGPRRRREQEEITPLVCSDGSSDGGPSWSIGGWL